MKKIISITNIVSITVFFLILFGMLIAINRISMIEKGIFDGFFNSRYYHIQTETLVHILFGGTYLLLAPFLILNRMRNQSIRIHRFLGKICLFSGFILGVYACIIHYNMSDGLLLSINGWFSSLFFLFALSMAFYNIKIKNIQQHRNWMVRAFCVALGAFVVVRLFSFITFSAFTDIDLLSTSLTLDSSYQVSLVQSILFLSSWLGTLIPLLIGEVILKNSTRSASKFYSNAVIS